MLMSEQDFGTTPAEPGSTATEGAWQTRPPAGYAQQPPPPAGYAPPPMAAGGLSESTASVLAYLTWIPALVFLLVAPYNLSPRIKFHAIQELGLTVASMAVGIVWIVPILGWIVGFLGFSALLVCWVLCIVKASQGSAFKLPVIGDFAVTQSGYTL
jgi:uncharacterized membrane protein